MTIREAANDLAAEIETFTAQNDAKSAQDAIVRFAEFLYKAGYKDAITNYAVWRDGQQHVGVMNRPLKAVLEEVDKSSVPIIYF